MISRVLDIDNFDGKSDMDKNWLTIIGKEYLMIPIDCIDIGTWMKLISLTQY
jgi:hypothetical protein